MSISVAIVDDQRLVREGFASLLSMHEDFLIVGTAADGEEAIALVSRERPDVVLMDLRMPRMDGISATRAVATTTYVIALTTYGDDGPIREALAAGARGYLTKDVGFDEIASAIRTVASGGTTFSRFLTTEEAPLDTLTVREREILALIVRGVRNDDIAGRCGISKATVKSHVHTIFAKLGARDRAEVVRRALSAGLID